MTLLPAPPLSSEGTVERCILLSCASVLCESFRRHPTDGTVGNASLPRIQSRQLTRWKYNYALGSSGLRMCRSHLLAQDCCPRRKDLVKASPSSPAVSMQQLQQCLPEQTRPLWYRDREALQKCPAAQIKLDHGRPSRRERMRSTTRRCGTKKAV